MEKETDEFLNKNEIEAGKHNILGKIEIETSDKIERGRTTFLYLSAVTANLLMLSCSSGFSWTSPVFTLLKKSNLEENPLGRQLTPLEESLITSLYCLGATAISPFAGKLADSLGRRRLLLWIAFPKVICLLVLAFATNIWIYYITRFLMGIVLGIVFTVLPMFLAEISELHNRGTVGSIMNIFINFGILYIFIIGPFLSVKALTLCSIIPLLLFIVLFGFFIPESPVFLVSKNRNQQALKALVKLRGKQQSQVQDELRKLSKMIENGRKQRTNISNIFKDRGLSKGVVISIMLPLLQQFAGIYAVLAFMGPIFDASATGLSTYVATNLVCTIRVVSTFITAALMERLGRKTLLLISSTGTGVSLVFLGLYFYFKNDLEYDMSLFYWLPVTSVITYMVFYNLGLSGIPFILPNELFPSHIKALASSVASFSCFTSSFVVTLIFPVLRESAGMAVCFWLFLGFTMFGTIYIYIAVPETKGKMPTEVQEYLNNK
ncbi:facilitated trehalose transporter Tret1 [Leptinotarsa decemlineata]|uniref:facilitated trehalose transporter Tret1 n=1 Tax=Leptinotarsa decemlineata TaxID=7539 RepID=UPI003D309F14